MCGLEWVPLKPVLAAWLGVSGGRAWRLAVPVISMRRPGHQDDLGQEVRPPVMGQHLAMMATSQLTSGQHNTPISYWPPGAISPEPTPFLLPLSSRVQIDCHILLPGHKHALEQGLINWHRTDQSFAVYSMINQTLLLRPFPWRVEPHKRQVGRED